MDRRDFVRLASAAGLSLVAPSAWGGRDLSFGRPNPTAADDRHEGPFFLCFHADGGWDPTHICDAKPKQSELDPTPMTNVLPQDVGEVVPGVRFPTGFDPGRYAGGGAAITAFMETYSTRMTVLNGLDLQTNGHGAGKSAVWSGVLGGDYPSLAAYLAATYNPTLPMAFLAFLGFNETRDIAPRVRAGNLDVLRDLSFPNRLDPDDPDSTAVSSKALELIDEARWHRDEAMRGSQRLPQLKASMSTLFTARAGAGDLKRLEEFLPAQREAGVAGQAQVAIAAFRAGISVSANLGAPGFDSHGSHDSIAIPRTDAFLDGIDFAVREAERHGLADKLIIVVGSELGRTPGYNSGGGKDHWPITSMMFMGEGIPKGKVVGASSERHSAYGIDDDLRVVADVDSGQNYSPAHVHWAFRKKFAMGDDNVLAELFPMTNERKLELF